MTAEAEIHDCRRVWTLGCGSLALPAEASGWVVRRTRSALRGREEPAGRAAAQLARFYLQGGEGLPKDPLSAHLWFRRAAEGGDVASMAALAEMLASGHGCLRDPGQARAWYEAAAKAGDTRAAAWLRQNPEPAP